MDDTAPMTVTVLVRAMIAIYLGYLALKALTSYYLVWMAPSRLRDLLSSVPTFSWLDVGGFLLAMAALILAARQAQVLAWLNENFGLLSVPKAIRELKSGSGATAPSQTAAQLEQWLLPVEAAERFASPDLVEAWKRNRADYQPVVDWLHAQLLSGTLIARGTPHRVEVGTDYVVIARGQWQSLKLAGPNFSSAASTIGPMHSYNNLEMGRRRASDVGNGAAAMHLAAFARVRLMMSGTLYENVQYLTGENIRQMKEEGTSGIYVVEFQRPVHSASLIVKQDGIQVPTVEKTRRRAKFIASSMEVGASVMFEFECLDIAEA